MAATDGSEKRKRYVSGAQLCAFTKFLFSLFNGWRQHYDPAPQMKKLRHGEARYRSPGVSVGCEPRRAGWGCKPRVPRRE